MPYHPPPIPDFTGRLLDDGRYRMLKQIGGGTYGVVYQALDLAHYKFIARPPVRAIKIISKKGLTKRQSVYLRREYNIHLVMGEHPNIVSLHRGFEDREYAYLVLEYCPGGDLYTKACGEGLYWRNDQLLKKIIFQIIDALEACHLRNVSHRDLKPENILTNEDGSAAFLTDFGLSTNQVVADGFGCGSAPYMSPECIGIECDHQSYSSPLSDIWSLGIMLLNLACARLPWHDAMTTDNNFHKFILDPDYLRTVFPISKGFNEIICRMLELLPESRLTLAQLRVAITNLDTFFMTEDEIASSSPKVKEVAHYVARRAYKAHVKRNPGAVEKKVIAKDRNLPKIVCGNRFKMQRVGSRGQRVDIDLETGKGLLPEHNAEEIIRHLGYRPPAPIAPRPVERKICGSIDITSLAIPSVNTSASTEDSDGPITPEQLPVDPDVVVSDMEDDLGMAVLSSDGSSLKPRPLRVVNQVDAIESI